MNKRGISLISLIITIVVIIILASITIYTGLQTPTQANFYRFTSEIDGVRVELRSIKSGKI